MIRLRIVDIMKLLTLKLQSFTWWHMHFIFKQHLAINI